VAETFNEAGGARVTALVEPSAEGRITLAGNVKPLSCEGLMRKIPSIKSRLLELDELLAR
jgi:hypothetical protein